MADATAEQVLGYLREPTVVAGLGAAAALTAAYVATRPQPTKCPVDPEQQSIELPGEDYARVSAILGEKLIERYFEDVSTIHDAFLRGVRISGDKPCIGHRSSPDGPYTWLTYNEVLEAATDVGSGLIELGCGSSQDLYTFIGVYAPNKPEWVLIEQACGMFSFTIIPLYDTLGPDACVYIINQAKMSTAVCDEAKIPILLQRCDQCPNLKNIIKIGQVTDEEKARGQECGIRIISFADVQEMGKNHKHDKKPSTPESLAVVCYTSGTTGNPKGAMLTHANAISMVSALILLVEKCGIEMSNTDVHISYLPLAHMYERLAQLMIFMVGGRVGFFGGNVRRIMEDLQELKPTLFISVPRVLNRVYDKVIKEVSSSRIKKFLFDLAFSFKKAELERNIVRRNSIWDYLVFRKIQNTLGGRVRCVISGSAPLRDDVMIFLRCALGCTVLEGYGQTETTAAASIQLIGDQTYGHVGPPLPCNKIKLVDVPEMECYAKDGKGEVCFYGPNVFKGYLHEPDKTREAIDEDGWLHSGDVAQWLPNGTLKIFDRKKDIFKLAQGEYIAPEKIEAVYSQCELVHQVYVYGDSKKACLVAVVIPEEGPLMKWAQKNDVTGDLKSFCDNEKATQAILSQMTSHGKKQGLHSFEQVKAIYLHEEIFSVENGLLTPTLKFKRPALKKQFLGTFDKLYSVLGE